MTSGFSPRRPYRVFAAAVPPLAALLLCGCGESLRYSPELHYPARTDPIVDTSPSEQPWAPEQPGRLDESIAQIGKKPGGKVTDPKTIGADLRAKLRDALDGTFGTPYAPRIGAAKDEDQEVVTQLARLKVRDANEGSPFHTIATGSKAFRFHCVHCHGLTGDGRGPTGPWVVPHPRDYRAGKFKFISAQAKGGRPRRDDLLRTLHQGIDGTSMPSFALLSDEELHGLASYVMHLSMRGEVELRILEDLANGNEYPDMADEVHSRMAVVVKQWADADGAPIVPDKNSYKELSHKQMAESIRRGYAAFSNASNTASCIGCHQDYGRQVPFKYDAWGTLVRPANLTLGVYRGGRRPIDLYWRIRGGIDPSGMPAQANDPANAQRMKDEEVWDIVNFVQAMPYPQMLPEDVRYKIYDRPPEEHAEKSAEHLATENTVRKN